MNYTIEEKENFNVLIAKEGYVLHLIGDEGYTNEIGEYTPPYYTDIIYFPKNVSIEDYEAIRKEDMIIESEMTDNGSN